LQKAFLEFETDPAMKYGISSLYVIEAKTGKVLFDKNSRLGLAPASTQKIITSATAFELLGINFQYRTELWMAEDEGGRNLLYIEASGDPTFGSWRYAGTKPEIITGQMAEAIKKQQIKKDRVRGLTYNAIAYPAQQFPGGWIWDDIGNYYGAAADILNWKENQYDIILRSGDEVGDSVQIVSPQNSGFINQLRSAEKGSGDNAYVYFQPDEYNYVISGSIPIKENNFKISASDAEHVSTFINDLSASLKKEKIIDSQLGDFRRRGALTFSGRLKKKDLLYTHRSPSLDSIVYWFNRKSINLYGEALVKTFAYEKQGYGSTDSGVALLRRFWKEKGIEEDELNMYDGSGLSPLNRVTTHAQVEILKFAKGRDWYPAFYESLPEYNNMKMKSGTISDVKGFCGYHRSKDGREYIFSFLVNNYSGRASAIVAKMYKVLDVLK
jgi:D-alanyl-D-alanine carboxypeptidase/D-alanyl-D-alanine-endopeptidase (penicillin-binding protein 4)